MTTLGLGVALAPLRGTAAQATYGNLEFQIGAQLATSPLYRDPAVTVKRAPGVSAGLVVYSYLHNPIGFRVRGDVTINRVRTRTGPYIVSDQHVEWSAGFDALPRAIRIVARGIEARFYGGLALRLIQDEDDVCILESGPPCGTPIGTRGVDVIGRAGWFIRHATRASLLRFDIAYQVGEIGDALQHDILLRVGIGD